MAWTAYHLKNGKPATEAYVVEQPQLGWLLGWLFLFVGLVNLAVTRTTLAIGVVFTLLGLMSLIAAGRDARRRKVPAPQTAPLVDDSLRPLPGEAEGADAGWYPVTGEVQRWWTGARWAQYVMQKGRVRPTHFRPRAYRNGMVVMWILAGLGLLLLTVGIAVMVGDDRANSIVPVMAGAFLLAIGVIMLVLMRFGRYAVLLPVARPPIRGTRRD